MVIVGFRHKHGEHLLHPPATEVSALHRGEERVEAEQGGSEHMPTVSFTTTNDMARVVGYQSGRRISVAGWMQADAATND